MRTVPASFPSTIWFFSDYFLFFSQGFRQFWEQSVNENRPCILSLYYLIFFWLLFVFFSGFLPVLRTICKWEPSLHPFPILFVFFLITFCFFLRVFARFENYERVVFLICFLFFLLFFPWLLCVNSLVCVWFIFVVFLILSLSMWKWFVFWAESWFIFFCFLFFFGYPCSVWKLFFTKQRSTNPATSTNYLQGK